jgi:lysophospholipase L1-like esterase
MIRTCQGYSRDQSVERAFQVNELLKSAAEKNGVHFVNPVEVLCPAGLPTCLRVVDNSLIFHDNNHLSGKGASLLFDAMMKGLKGTIAPE